MQLAVRRETGTFKDKNFKDGYFVNLENHEFFLLEIFAVYIYTVHTHRLALVVTKCPRIHTIWVRTNYLSL